jgi:hypothetical protein
MCINLPKTKTDLQEGSLELELDWTSLRIEALKHIENKISFDKLPWLKKPWQGMK